MRGQRCTTGGRVSEARKAWLGLGCGLIGGAMPLPIPAAIFVAFGLYIVLLAVCDR
jgi:hypothetical protein